MAGIVEIAAKAGVSPATVSRALRGLHHVNAETRTAIVKAARDLKYPLRVDLIPREERVNTNVVGVIAPYITRWYFSQAINGIEQTLREAGYDLLLYNFSEVEARQRIFQKKQLQGKVDALIVVSLPPTDQEFKEMLGLGIPLSLIGFEHEGCNSVRIDDVAGARMATDHLIEYGHRDIAILSGQRDSALGFNVSDERTEGFLQAMQASGIDWNPEYEMRGDYNIQTSEVAVESFFSRRKKLPTAIFCHSDEMAFGAMKSLRKKGLRIPEDISVIGFDDHEIAQYVGLTTVSQPPQFQGQLAASSIITRLAHPDAAIKPIHVPTSLVIRETTARI
jgi:DNA-binding LacI/PurR family transcriptional regulator